MKPTRSLAALSSIVLFGMACTSPAPEPPTTAPHATKAAGNPFQEQLTTGEPPPVATRGTLELRVVHTPGGALHSAYVAILRARTDAVVWTDEVASTRLPLGAGTYDARIDRLGGSVLRSGIVIEQGLTTRVELVTDTGALKLTSTDGPNGVPKAAMLRVAPAATLDFIWSELRDEATLVLAAGTYDVHCARDGRKGLVKDVVVSAGATRVAPCILR
jgi:hypothetical protein